MGQSRLDVARYRRLLIGDLRIGNRNHRWAEKSQSEEKGNGAGRLRLQSLSCCSTYTYLSCPFRSSNSEASGGDFHGGNTAPWSFDPSSKMICSRVVNWRPEKGSFGLVLDINALETEHLLVPCKSSPVLRPWFLMCSATSSSARHLRSVRSLLSSSDAKFKARIHNSAASSVAASASSRVAARSA